MKQILITLFLATSIMFGQTDGQIKQAKEMMKSSGMSEVQAKEMAKSKGYSDQQIDAAIQKEKSSKTKDASTDFNENSKSGVPELGESNEVKYVTDSEKEIVNIDQDEYESLSEEELEIIDEEDLDLESEAQVGRKALSYYGYDIFKRDPAIFQSSSVGAVDPNYMIGPGDEIIVMIWGETQFRQVLTVDREGFVFIPEIGQVFVNGLDLKLLESKLFRVLSQSYASLNPQGGKSTTFLDVSLGNLRSLRIQVLGEVAQPGAYTVAPSATLFSALYFFNGPTTRGSLRDIRLIRGGKEIVSIDFYDYLLTGKKPNDVKLQLDDVIFIPKRLSAVGIGGEINRPGIYELKPKESLEDLVALAGDLKITAYLDRAQIDRIIPFEDRNALEMDRMFIDVDLEKIMKDKKDYSLQDGDRIQIFSILDLRQNVVSLRGAVTRPGRFDLGDSLTLSALIEKADGLLGDAYMDRVDIVRIKPDFTEQLIKINLDKALANDLNHDILLQGLDRVRIYGMTEMVSQTYVSISGHVKRKGLYFLQENMTVYDLLFKAGGFVDEEWKEKAYLERADLLRLNDDQITRTISKFNLGQLLESPGSSENFFLEPGDKIKIYNKDVFISVKPLTINGSVKNPGKYDLKEKMCLKDLIIEAGGISEHVYRYKVEIARIDPNNTNADKYATIISMDMDDDLCIINENGIKMSQKGNAIEAGNGMFFLQAYDIITVRPDPKFLMQKTVFVEGSVWYPGPYVIQSQDETVTDILARAGGLRPEAYPMGSTFSRGGVDIQYSYEKILKNPRSKFNFTVKSGDKITIREHPELIYIRGEVNSPGAYKYIPGKRYRYYIRHAGLYTSDANNGDIFLQFPDGTSAHHKRWWLISNKIPDGTIITVGKERETEPFDKTSFAKDLAGIIGDLAQVIAMVLIAGK